MPAAAYNSVEKRSELVAAATRLLYEQGLERTTLADVASRAEVPTGNVYYYFKTKEALATAVIEQYQRELHERFDAWARAHRGPRGRLRAFVLGPLEDADRVIQFGCPHGSLCQEVEKLGADSPLARAARQLLAVHIDWAEEQFRAHGIPRQEARALAADLVGAVQGASLLASTLGSKELLTRQLRRIERWLDKVLSGTDS